MSDSVHSKVPGFLGCLAPVIVTSVAVSNRRCDKLLRVGVVKGGQLNRDVVATQLLNMSTLKGPHATVSTKQMMRNKGTELVVA